MAQGLRTVMQPRPMQAQTMARPVAQPRPVAPTGQQSFARAPMQRPPAPMQQQRTGTRSIGGALSGGAGGMAGMAPRPSPRPALGGALGRGAAGGMGGAPRPPAPRAAPRPALGGTLGAGAAGAAGGAPRPPAPRAPQRQPMAGGVLGRGAGLAMSDRESKERIRELEDLNDTYAALLDTPPATGNVRPKAPPTAALDDAYARETARAGSYEYEYKDPARHGEGRYVGPMADELRRLPGVVQRTPDGEAVDTSRLTLANTSALGSQERRLQDLERARSQGALSRGEFERLDEDYDALADARTTSAGDERLDEYLRARSMGAFDDGTMREIERRRR